MYKHNSVGHVFLNVDKYNIMSIYIYTQYVFTC